MMFVKITKRHLLAVVLIVGVSTMAGAGSYAYLTDSDTSEFSFMTGSLEVNTAPTDGNLEFGDIAESSPTADVTIANDGSLPARQVLWTDLDLSGNLSAAQATEIESVEYRGENVTGDTLDQLSAGNGNGIYDLDDVSSHLADDDIDLEAMVDGDGLDPNGNETAELAVTISVDYSQEGITEDNMDVTASVGVTGHQQSPDSDS